MNLSKEMAVRLHRMMWSDMLKELGNNPSAEMRIKFKKDWIERNVPEALVMHNCFLCEYSFHQEGRCCSNCPIKWPDEHCNGYNFSYEKAPISDILALPVKNEKLTGLKAKYIADETEAVRAYYTYREELLSKASGLPGSVCIEDHVKAIKEKAVDEYFKNTPGAKLATMDVDEAFKQYADEQKAPIFHALAEASGLSAGNESVKAHIYEISNKAESSGRKEKAEEIFKAMSVYSGVAEGNWSVYDHAMAIIKEERERIMDKIGEMLNDKSARETKNS